MSPSPWTDARRGDLEGVVVLEHRQMLPYLGGHGFLLEPRVADATRDEDRVGPGKVGNALQKYRLRELVSATRELDSEVFWGCW